MKTQHKIAICILSSILILCTGCQKISENILSFGGNVSTPQYAGTPVKTYSTPLPEFQPMQFAWFYKPPQPESDLGAIAANYSLMILTRNDEGEREKMREMGSDSLILQYLRFETTMNPGSCSEMPMQNQVAHLEGDFCLLESQHPDWFLKDINGKIIQYNQSDYVFMDPGNSEWQAYYLEKVKGFQQDTGWQGVFLDNVDGSLGRFEKMHLLLDRYPDDSSYQQAVLSMLQYLYNEYFAASNNTLYANIPYLKDHAIWLDYLNYLDGAMLEAFAADWDSGYLGNEEWIEQLNLAEKTQAMGKDIILVTQGNINDLQRMQFGLASFLLVNNGQAYFRYSNDAAYRNLWWYSQYETDLGQPLGPRYPDGESWRRDFERGYVSVNPAKHTAEIQSN